MDFQPMSSDDMQRAMQFLLNQQAQFAADFARMAEAQAANEARWTQHFDQLSAKTDRIADGLIGLTGIVGQLAASQLRTDEQLRESEARWREADRSLKEHIDAVDSHLSMVIDMFERHLREDHGNRPS